MEELPIILIRGLGLGAIYALLGMSMNAIYRSSGILNFAQGSMFVLAGMIAVQFVPAAPNPMLWFIMLPLAALALATLMAMQGYVTLLPLRSSVEQHSWLVTTLAASVVISAVILLFQGTAQVAARSPFASVSFMGTRTPAPYLIAIALAIGWCVALRLFFSRTLTGLSISAVAQDLDAARAAGLRVRRLQIMSFAISGLVAGSAGFAAAPVAAIANDSGIVYSTNAFVAAVVGGMGNDAGALVGGALVGVASMYAAYAYGGEFQNLVTLGLLVLVLMVRPEGLFGTPMARRV
jgi:branched-chain amino acid transport system permease protein